MKFITFLSCLLCFSMARAEPVLLEFKYTAGDTERLRVKMDFELGVAVTADLHRREQKSSGPIQMTFTLDCLDSRPDGYDLEAGFSDLEVSQRITTDGQTVAMFVDGDDVRLEAADGTVLVDTKAGINTAAAQEVLKEFEDFDEKATFTLDRRGLIRGMRKDSRLKEFFGGTQGDNLWPVVLPKEPVEVGSSWTYSFELLELGNFKITGEPPRVTVHYRLERLDGNAGTQTAVVSMHVDETIENVTTRGYMEGVNGEMVLHIDEVRIKGDGRTRFLPGSGRLASTRAEMSVAASMDLQVPTIPDALQADVDFNISIHAAPEPITVPADPDRVSYRRPAAAPGR